jgi:hypothetical protein
MVATLEVSSDACHDLQRRFKGIASNQFLRTQVLLSPPVLFGPRVTIRLQELLAVVGKVVLVEGESRRSFHLQQPIDLLERDGVALGENFIDDGPNVSGTSEGRKRTHEGGGLT